MFGSTALEVGIGIIFVFILVSVICSAVREGIEAWLKTRAAYLEHGIRELLNDKKGTGLAKSVFEHPLIFGLFSDDYQPGSDKKKPPLLANGRGLPSYIPSRNFAVALMDIAARGPQTDEVSSHPESPVISLETIRQNIMNLDSPFVQRALLTAIDSAQGDLNRAQKNIENWFDSSMDRISGWYKRSTQWVLFWVGLGVAVGLNVNTITVADYLFRNDMARREVVARAEAVSQDTASQRITYLEARRQLDSLKLPIGWEAGWGAPRRETDAGYRFGIWNNILAPILGLLITALAAMLGAPFWFDLLNKVMVIRSTVKPREKSPEEASEDRQFPKTPPPVVVAAGQAPPPAGGGGGGTTAPQMPASNIRDADSAIDGCDVELAGEDITPDEELPPAEGGVET